eukprot:g4760.t1
MQTQPFAIIEDDDATPEAELERVGKDEVQKDRVKGRWALAEEDGHLGPPKKRRRRSSILEENLKRETLENVAESDENAENKAHGNSGAVGLRKRRFLRAKRRRVFTDNSLRADFQCQGGSKDEPATAFQHMPKKSGKGVGDEVSADGYDVNGKDEQENAALQKMPRGDAESESVAGRQVEAEEEKNENKKKKKKKTMKKKMKMKKKTKKTKIKMHATAAMKQASKKVRQLRNGGAVRDKAKS